MAAYIVLGFADDDGIYAFALVVRSCAFRAVGLLIHLIIKGLAGFSAKLCPPQSAVRGYLRPCGV
ncbi:hypothetical protein SDC9_124228 [bioreactor metagenome]|uniref:Uncharacterized protein n=1 Tax=bioreactor metagenome TaxID=1076179 RepID=A0A645CJZ7_9ZZZZ